MKRKKTAHETVAEVIAKVEEELVTSRVTIEPAPAPKEEDTKKTHYFRCNVTLDNGKPCNCTAFM